MARSLGFLCVPLMLLGNLLVAEDPVVDRIFAQTRHDGLSGTFDLETHRADEGEGAGERHQGRFSLATPNRYDLTLTKPSDEEWSLRWCSDGTEAWQVEYFLQNQAPDEKRLAVGEEEDGFANLLRRLLLGDRKALDEAFTVEASESASGPVLTLTPKDPAVAERLRAVVMVFDASLRPVRLSLDDFQGNRRVLTVTDLHVDPDFPEGTFHRRPPGP